MPGIAIGISLVGGTKVAGASGNEGDEYFRPGGVDTYFRPGGVDSYLRP